MVLRLLMCLGISVASSAESTHLGSSTALVVSVVTCASASSAFVEASSEATNVSSSTEVPLALRRKGALGACVRDFDVCGCLSTCSHQLHV